MHGIGEREPIVVRDAAVDELAAVAAVMGAATAQLRGVYRPTQEAIVRARAAPVRWLVALRGGEMVGVLRYGVEEDRLHLGLGVRPEHQGRGVGRALIEGLTRRAIELGLSRLSLYTIEETGNVPIFERLGFRSLRKEPAQGLQSVDGGTLTDVYMELPIAPPDDRIDRN